ncbi:DUF3105 domain-containing protein [Micromonospora sp. NBC_00858]|uniref:DUF3105 domain-containing protein n=1 Tax=Micromonospora sp. NBC_00858 TaxID=2975979 RepID=UPI0038641735|nr:DUF3105 domain-containing protein [Micromonospora sp. NBC_00858]
MAEARAGYGPRIAAVAVAFGVVLLVVAIIPFLRAYADPVARRPAAAIGVAADRAGCDPELTDPIRGAGVHVGPGTAEPHVTRIQYDLVPPSSGPHFVVPAPTVRRFYTARDRPPVETLVHNLEHGYTILWYVEPLAHDQIEALRALARKLGGDRYGGRFVVAPWDPGYGAFPAGRPIALSHWGAHAGYRQFCASVSGAAVERFVLAHPAGDAPEPTGM